MDRQHRGLHGIVVIVALIVGACGSATTSTPTGAGASPSPTLSLAQPSLLSAVETPLASDVDAAATPAPADEATPAPTSKPAPAATPAPVTTTRWTKPRQIGTLKTCSTVTAGIDVASRYHVAAECDGSIHYYASTDARSWTATVFAHRADRADLNPQIAFRGNVVYVGFSRIAPDGGCSGSRGIDLGVYIRHRTQPDGAWSTPVRIGSPGDSLRSFRVDGETIYATVWNAGTGRSYYETLTGSTFHRYRIHAYSETSLRVGSDGRARIAYLAAGGMRLATFNGTGFSTSVIGVSSPANGEYDTQPVLAIDGNDKAHVVWTRREEAACGPGPGVGTYYATNASGTWKSQRVTKDVGVTSLQVDDATGRVHLLVGGERTGLLYCTKSPGGQWTRTKVASTKGTVSLALRLDPATGTLLAVYLAPASDWGPGRIYVLMKR